MKYITGPNAIALKKSGADRDRTDDLLDAIEALSQLSYSPINWNKKNPSRVQGSRQFYSKISKRAIKMSKGFEVDFWGS
jgi:hypothetical protein